MLSELKSIGTEPRVHPNGFIQLDLSKQVRLHVWHPHLPYRQKTFSPIHNHIFSFDSEVIVGRMVNQIYTIEPDDNGTHEEWQVNVIDGEDTKLVRTGEGRVRLVPEQTDVVLAGSIYHMPKYAFHETLVNEPTATFMTKHDASFTMGPNCQGASVLVPWFEEPDNDFRRGDVDTDLLWKLIGETLNRINA